MDGREFRDKLSYTGMVKGARRLALKEKLAKAEELAVMSEIDVCNLIMTEYDVAFAEDERVGLVKRDNFCEFEELVEIINR